jgi:hypothetical protein
MSGQPFTNREEVREVMQEGFSGMGFESDLKKDKARDRIYPSQSFNGAPSSISRWNVAWWEKILKSPFREELIRPPEIVNILPIRALGPN